MIFDKTTVALLQDEEIAKYQRIYEITKRMKINTNLEPTLTEMMNGGTQKYLNG